MSSLPGAHQSLSVPSSSSSSAALYTRSALLQWVNRSLSTTHPSLDSVPAKHVALLLNAIYGHASFPLNRIDFSVVSSNTTNNSSSESIGAGSGSSRSNAASVSASSSRAAQLRNCEVVLSQARSHLGYEGRLSAALWLAKEDTANELLFWRWVRQSAEGRGWAGCINAEGLMQHSSSTSSAIPPAVVPVADHHHHHQHNTDNYRAHAGVSIGEFGGVGADGFRKGGEVEEEADSGRARKRAPRPEEVKVEGGGGAVSASVGEKTMMLNVREGDIGNPKESPHYTSDAHTSSLPSGPSSLPSSSSDAAAQHRLHSPPYSAPRNPTPTPTPQQIAHQNATYMRQTADAAPIGREAEAYHASLAMLQHHLQKRRQEQHQQQHASSLVGASTTAIGISTAAAGMGGVAAMNTADGSVVASSSSANAMNTFANYNAADGGGVGGGPNFVASVPTDPYVAAIIDAKADKLRFLQSLRTRLIAACHAKDRSKVAEIMCEYIRGGGLRGDASSSGSSAGLLLL